jgi:N utilization substance protein B
MEAVIERISNDEMFNAEGRDFFARLVRGGWQRRDELDAVIERLAPTWPIHQMPGVDKAVLRIALFEISFDTATDKAPVKAVINEAVELSKHYGSDSSSRFVNGVLSTVVNKP